jgi:hypothetical protein
MFMPYQAGTLLGHMKYVAFVSTALISQVNNHGTSDSPNCAGSKEPPSAGTWNQMFIQQGGLRHLFDIFMSGTSCIPVNFVLVFLVYYLNLQSRKSRIGP